MTTLHSPLFPSCKSRLRALFTVALGATLAACGDSGTAATDTESTTESGTTSGQETETGEAELPAGCDIFVAAGEGAEDALVGALIDAPDDSVVCLGEGEFLLNNEISISGDGITLRGMGEAKTSFAFDTENFVGGDGMKITGDRVTVEDFSVVNAPGDGIVAESVEDITYQRVTVYWTEKMSQDNGAYGIYPVQSTRVTIKECTVYGARDAGIYVGQSTMILIEDSEAYDNVAGFEIENSTGATVRNNYGHDNTAGLLIFNLPGLAVQDGKETVAYGNTFEDNNVVNWGVPGTAVAAVPYGIGVMVMASDYNELRDNTIRNNESVAVVIVGYHDFIFDPVDDPSYDILAEGTYVHNNTMENNGTNPDPQVILLAGEWGMNPPVPDIGWDGCVDGDKDNTDGRLDTCLSDNGSARFLDMALCGGKEKSDDIAAVTCTHPELPELPEGY